MKAEKEVEQKCERTKNIQSTDKRCEWSPALHNASNDGDECSRVLWLRLLLTTLICLLHGIALNFVTICNLIQLLFVINFLCYHHHRSGCLRAVSATTCAAVSFQLEFHLPHRFLSSKSSNASFMLPTYPLHTPWLLYSRPFAHLLFGRQNKELGAWGITFITLRFSTL